MKKLYWMVVLLVLGLGSQAAMATKLYKWVDEFGNVTYRDTPPTENTGQYEEKYINGGTTSGGPSEATEDAVQAAPVVLYVTSNCSACDAASSYMRSRGVPFQQINVEGNGEKQQELKAKAGELSVPTILVGEKVMRGYVQSLLEGELDAAGYPKSADGESATPQEPEADLAPDQPEPPEEANPVVE
jgi:glutaredoxin